MINIGNNSIDNIFVGEILVDKVYLGTDVIWEHEIPIKNYLKFTALDDGTFTLTIPASVDTSYITSISYSTDDGETWTTTQNSNSEIIITTPIITSGNSVLWKGDGNGTALNLNDNNYSNFTSSENFACSGNIMSLLYLDKITTQKALTNSFAFAGLFKNCSTLITIDNLEFPATTLTTGCYKSMFDGCTLLTTAPNTLPATTLVLSCYEGMFKNCTSLLCTPKLPALIINWASYKEMFSGCTSLTTITQLSMEETSKESCMYMFNGCTSLTSVPDLHVIKFNGQLGSSLSYMFAGCTSLVTAPALPATNLKSNTTNNEYGVYKGMFQDCTSLTTAPALPATILSSSCYMDMFNGCSSLTTAPSLPAETLIDGCYRQMFQGCTSLTTAPTLSSTILANSCYYRMFHSCSGLTAAPELPASTLAEYCYFETFYGCKSLTVAPVLSATTLANHCYDSMFRFCSSLTTIPSTLPATTLTDYCYRMMFQACTSLVNVPSNLLPATTLTERCYSTMFGMCSSLTTAPELPARTLVDGCYNQMFAGCSKINYVKCLATDISATNCTYQWFYQARNQTDCTFVKYITMNDWTRTVSGIPTNWNVQDYSDVHVTGVTISSTAETITKGGSVTLTATVSPNDAYDKSVTWSTSDTTVATVSDGVVTAVGCGNATITVTTTDGGYTAQCATTVENPVTGVSLNTNILTILTGLTYQLEATVSPSDACGDKSVTWSSSDSTIATVSNNGLVTAVATGSAVVTVTTTVGSYTASCAVEVTEPVAVTGVTLNESTLDIVVGQTSTLAATVLPNNATDKTVTWSSSNNNIATVTSGGVVTAVSAGTANITVTTHDGGYTASCEVTVTEPTFTTISIEGASSVSAETCEYRAVCDNVEDVTSSAIWSITAGSQYATINPSNGHVTILNGANESSVTIQVVYGNLTGTSTVTLTYVSGAVSETTSVITTDVGGNSTSVVTTITTYADSSSTEVTETIVTDVNGDLVGSSESTKATNADGSYEGVTTNYDANGDPVNGSNVTGDTDGNVSTQTVEYDESGNTVVTGYDIDTSESESGKTFNHDGVNTDYYAFDLTHGFVLDFDFTIDFSNQPPNQQQGHHNILNAKRADQSPYYGFQLRHSSDNTVIQLGTQFETGSNANTDINPTSKTGNVGTYNLRIVYDPNSSGKKFICTNTVTGNEIYSSVGIFPDLEELKNLKVTIGYAVDGSGNPFRYSNITVQNFELKKLKNVANPTITYEYGAITINCSTVGADIYYRLNLSGNYSAYTAPITITADTVVQAYATYSGDTSDIIREDFKIVNVTGVTLSDNSISIIEGGTYTLSATVLPNDALDKSVTWSSSDSNVASVDSNGVVSGVASGSATITVTTHDGGYTAQCSVSVTSHDYSNDYFTIESLADGNEIKMQRAKTPNNPTLSYSLDDGETWTTETISGTKSFGTINTGDKIIFKGNNTKFASAWDTYNYFNATKQFKVYGNIMSLFNGDDFKTNYEFNSSVTHHCVGLFRTAYLVDASNLILPALTIYSSSYNGMFRGATALQHGPQMLATTPTGTECCSSMFEGCINLEEAIEINFTTLSQQCCFRMFLMDRNLKITTPKMTKSPILRCNTAAQDCYKEMFKGNGNLNEITCLLTTSTGGTVDWIKNAATDTGTFYKSPLKNDWPTTANGVPTGWTVVDYTEE